MATPGGFFETCRELKFIMKIHAMKSCGSGGKYKRITDPQPRGADYKSATATWSKVKEYPEEQGKLRLKTLT